MTHFRYLAPVVGFLIVLSSSEYASAKKGNLEAETLELPQERVPGQALVKFADEDIEDDAIENVLRDIQEEHGITLTLIRPALLGWGLFQIEETGAQESADERKTLSLIEALRDADQVRDATANRWYRRYANANDPGYSDMWHLQSIGVSSAWDVSTGTSSQRIGVVDTGTLRNHADLASKDVAGYDFISNTASAGDGNGRDSDYTDSGDGADCGFGYQGDSWHGTHVAGTILASTNNGQGIAGVNQNAGLVTARVLGKCGGSLADIMDGAAWMAGASIQGVPSLSAADQPSVMNLSLGGASACSGYEQDVVDWVNDQGKIFVAAAGNDGAAVGSPANCLGVVTVAAHGPGNSRPLSNYSNFGSYVEVVAPGGAIATSYEQGVLSAVGPGNNDYDWYEGTSMAAPHVAGAISLMHSLDPSLRMADVVALMQENGSTCTGCSGVPALRIDLVLNAMVENGIDQDPDDSTQDDTPVDTGPGQENDDVYEPNQSWGEAPKLECGAALNLYMATGDADWFMFEVEPGTEISASMYAGEQDLDLYVLDGPTNENIIGSSYTETGNEQVSVNATTDLIAVAVVPWENAAGSYGLSVNCTAPVAVDDDTETDDNDDADLDDDVNDDENTEDEDPIDTDPEDPIVDADDEEEVEMDDIEAQETPNHRPASENVKMTSGCSQTSSSTHGMLVALLSLLGFGLQSRRKKI